MEQKEAKRILIFNIRRIIKDKGLKQCAVAEKAGLSKASISKWKNASPTADNLKAVAKVLKVKVDKLLE